MKSIKSLISKLEPDPDGNISGGYSFIKGGRTSKWFGNNTNSCENSATCSGTNTGGVLTGCINSTQCAKSTNDSNCSNSLVCPPIR